MEVEEYDNIDPIYGDLIDPREAYILGKTKYSVNSLFEWFLLRKNFINPMTNDSLTNEELKILINKFKEVDLFPAINNERIPIYKTIIIMEKYKNYKISISRNNDRINKLNTQINKKYDNIAKALKRKDQEKGQKLVQNHMTHIRKMEEQILRLEKVGKNIESVQQENIKSFIAWTKAN